MKEWIEWEWSAGRLRIEVGLWLRPYVSVNSKALIIETGFLAIVWCRG